MLSIRVIPTMLYRDGTLVKGRQFDSGRRVGGVVEAMRIYAMRQVDELVLLDVSATEPNVDLVDNLSRDCFVPFSVGGGVKTLTHFRDLLRAGADKVIVGTAAVETPELITQAAQTFGSQCVVVSVDYRDGVVWTHSGRERTDLDPVEWCKRVEELGAGEILLQSIERDGTMEGYDLDTLRRVKVGIPVVVSGGASGAGDMCAAVEAGADAVAAGAIFHFTQVTPIELKRAMALKGYPMRLTA